MTTHSATLPLAAPPVAVPRRARAGQATSTLAYDRIWIVLSAWLLTGLFVDGWAHVNLRSLETFFTPWHGLFYSGFFAVTAWLGVGIGRGRAAGFQGLRMIPAGYELSALGAAIFLVGGVGDMIWHQVFGIEVDLEALLSPTHLLLALGLGLLVSGPFRAAVRRAQAGRVADGWSVQLPLLFAVTFVFGLLAFFSQYLHPTSSGWAAAAWQPIGRSVPTVGGRELELEFLFQAPLMAGVMLQTALLVGLVLYTLRHARLPFGALTLLIGLTTVGMVLMRTRFVVELQTPMLIAGILAGVLGDVLVQALRPSFERPRSVHLLAVLLPVAVYAAYFGMLLLAGGMWWTVHLWTGAIVLAGVVGGLLSLLTTPAAGARSTT